MSDAPERIAFRWEVGAAITSGPLMNHPDYVHYVRADRIEELEAKLEMAVDAFTRIDDLTCHNMPMTARDEQAVNREARATLIALKGQDDE